VSGSRQLPLAERASFEREGTPVATVRVFSAAIALALMLLICSLENGPSVVAQSGSPCEVESLPDDDLASAAVGLTRQEMDALYGPGIAAQTGWIYQFAGFDLTLSNCDLILSIDPNGEFADFASARELVRTLLPEDAVHAGTWGFGTLQSVPQDADEWISGQLAARYRLLGEPRTGSILVLYTYDGDAYDPGSVIRVEIHPAVIPR
jgi:hypothetical protein